MKIYPVISMKKYISEYSDCISIKMFDPESRGIETYQHYNDGAKMYGICSYIHLLGPEKEALKKKYAFKRRLDNEDKISQ